jgi:small multidrug resistance pump
MLLTTIVISQILDPLRIVLVGIAYFLSRLVKRPGMGWLGLLAAIVVIAAGFPFVISGQSGDIAWTTAAIGVISNALIVAVVAGLLRLQRRFF